jgi:hypothetical protein
LATPDPLSTYSQSLTRWQQQRSKDQRSFILIGNARLGTFLALCALGWIAIASKLITAWILVLPIAAFVALAVVHERVVRRERNAKRAIAYYERGIARLTGKWGGTGNAGSRFLDPKHLYAPDLDVFGRASLFEFLASPHTTQGEALLASWLLAPGDVAPLLERQKAVAELRDRDAFREELGLLGDDVSASVQLEKLAAWGAVSAAHFFPGARVVAACLGVIALGCFVAYMGQIWTLGPFAGALLVNLLFRTALRRSTTRSVEEAEATSPHELEVLAALLHRIEQESFTSPRLKTLRAALDVAGLPASRQVSKLRRWIEFLESGHNLLVRILDPVILWREHAAIGLEHWRGRVGPSIAGWGTAVAELEALSSLGSYAFERPKSTFPEFVEEGPLFDATQLAHPLMSEGSFVPNDVRLAPDQQLLIVSGSNMSGKSTLLRSVGLNAVLAWAGAPVAAQRLRLSRIQLGVSIRVLDSLEDGQSRFYAEISRLRHIVDAASGPIPLLFLLDELFSGTNSHDRRIGAQAILRTLVSRGAIGLITTHDLALTQISQQLPQVMNVHFEDQLLDGRMSFDYRMRQGVVERSNALELMRAVGLEV